MTMLQHQRIDYPMPAMPAIPQFGKLTSSFKTLTSPTKQAPNTINNHKTIRNAPQKHDTATNEESGSIRNLFRAAFRRKPAADNKRKFFETLGGVFAEEGHVLHDKESAKSLDTIQTEVSCEGIPSPSAPLEWHSSGSESHHQGTPLISKTLTNMKRIGPDGTELCDNDILVSIMFESQKLPKNDGYLIGNHVMVNNERTEKLIPSLRRDRLLDEIARKRALEMAAKGELSHMDPAALREQLAGEEGGSRLGENVAKGSNLQVIHKRMMECLADRNNMVDRRFVFMGHGTSTAADGKLYLCQIFRG